MDPGWWGLSPVGDSKVRKSLVALGNCPRAVWLEGGREVEAREHGRRGWKGGKRPDCKEFVRSS